MGNRAGEHLVSIDMFVVNVFAICCFMLVCKKHERTLFMQRKKYENTFHAKKMNGKLKEHEQKLTEDDLKCKRMTR